MSSPAPRSRFPGTVVPGDKSVYDARDRAGADPARDLGEAGDFPFTRGPYKTMYRGKVWTMRMFSGFGTAADTNQRFRYLLEHGQTGLSTAFDMPTLMGYDSDHARSRGEVGREGVALCTLQNMEDRIKQIAEFLLQKNLWDANGASGKVAAAVDNVLARRQSPYQGAQELVREVLR